MLPKYSEILTPHEKWYPLLERNLVRINEKANRVVWTDSGRFAGVLVPGEALQGRMLRVEGNIVGELDILLQRIGMLNNIGAIASLANIGVSIVGFSMVMNRLNAMERTLGIVLDQLLSVRAALNQLKMHFDILSLMRIQVASETLEKALASNDHSSRNELARRARDLFQEARVTYGLLFHISDFWKCVDIPISAALALQSRFVACAIGEMQSNFLLGDEDSYKQACLSILKDYNDRFAIDITESFRARSDNAVRKPLAEFLEFELALTQLTDSLIIAQETTAWTEKRLIGFVDDGDLPRLLGMDPVDILRATRTAHENTIYLMGNIEDKFR